MGQDYIHGASGAMDCITACNILLVIGCFKPSPLVRSQWRYVVMLGMFAEDENPSHVKLSEEPGRVEINLMGQHPYVSKGMITA
jgi:hypothetical protein